MHPVGADDGIGGLARSVGEAEQDGIPAPVDADQPLFEGDQLRRHGGEQRRVQIAAVHQQIGRAVSCLGVLPESQLEKILAAVPDAIGPRRRLEGEPAQQGLQSERAQDVHGVGAHLDAGAEALELLRLLVELHLGTLARQERRQRQSADAGADDGKARPVIHGSDLRLRARGDAPVRKTARPAALCLDAMAVSSSSRCPGNAVANPSPTFF